MSEIAFLQPQKHHKLEQILVLILDRIRSTVHVDRLSASIFV